MCILVRSVEVIIEVGEILSGKMKSGVYVMMVVVSVVFVMNQD